MDLTGTWTALVTPFDEKGRFDKEAYGKIIEEQVKAGVQGICPCGTTGESATLSHEEHGTVIREAVKYAAGRIRVMAGTGSNSTQEAVEMTAAAAESGADCVLLVAPYYNRPSAEGLIRHFHTLAEKVEIPQIIYNIPKRTAVNIDTSTMLKITEHPNVVGVKEASGDLDQVAGLCASVRDGISVLSGDDGLLIPIVSVGGKGVISVASNLVPKRIVDLTQDAVAGRHQKALESFRILMPFIRALFLETNPVPVKAGMAMVKLCRPDVRLPLIAASEATRNAIEKTLSGLRAEGN